MTLPLKSRISDANPPAPWSGVGQYRHRRLKPPRRPGSCGGPDHDRSGLPPLRLPPPPPLRAHAAGDLLRAPKPHAEARRDERRREVSKDPLLMDLLGVLAETGPGTWPVKEIVRRLNDREAQKEREKPVGSKTVIGMLEGLGFERSLKRTDNLVHFEIDPARLKAWEATSLPSDPPSPTLIQPNPPSLPGAGDRERKLGRISQNEGGEGGEGTPTKCPTCGRTGYLIPGPLGYPVCRDCAGGAT